MSWINESKITLGQVSDEALSKINARKLKISDIPWDKIEEGMSIKIPYSEASNPQFPQTSFKTLRSKASYFGKKMGVKFRVVDNEEKCEFEIVHMGKRNYF